MGTGTVTERNDPWELNPRPNSPNVFRLKQPSSSRGVGCKNKLQKCHGLLKESHDTAIATH